MAILSDLPPELMVAIATRLKKLEDFVSFRCVSKTLYLSAKVEYFEGLRLRQRLPYLLLPVKDDNDDTRELYSLVEGESIVASVKVPNFKGKKCYESLGWLLAVEKDGNMSLLDPFSGNVIPVPHQNTVPGYRSIRMKKHCFIYKMVLSARPSETSDFILMIICGGCCHLAFWRPGEKAWNIINERPGRYIDVVHSGNSNEIFYAICYPGIVWVFKLVKNERVRAKKIVNCETILPYYGSVDPLPDYPSQKLYVLKTIDNSLLIITRKSPILSEDRSSYLTTKFQVYEVDKAKKSWKKIDSLGSMAVFVGHNSTIALDAARFPGGVIKADHIYFTHDDSDFYFLFSPTKTGGGLDIGVYNLKTGIIEPFYPGKPLCNIISTSLWINPPCF